MNIRKLVKAMIPHRLFGAVEPLGHLAEAVVFNVAYGFPARGLKVIGVTGTNGKTTTSFMIHRMLSDAGYKAGLMTTVAWAKDDKIIPQVHHMTNVPIPELMKRLRAMRQAGTEWLVLETTSHALAQHRTWGIPYSVAVLTNITHEHLDYHRTFERYIAAKKRLFQLAQRNKKGLQMGVANADDPQGPVFAAETQHAILYGIEKGRLRAGNIKLDANGISYDIELPGESYHIVSHLAGSFNVYNSLAAVGVGRALGLTVKQIEQGIASLDAVEGRMTTIVEGQAYSVIVDFAHTPDSFEKLLREMRPTVKGKLIVLFGSAGRRDEAKRAIQGRLAGEYADEVIVTEEDDRDIDGQEIMNQIAGGAQESGKKRDHNLFLVHDRTQAIDFAVGRASGPDDTVLLLGKGHEKTIERADGEHPWDEIATAHAAVRATLIGDGTASKRNK
jgi:UDP-N-acetylmuramoyl-L-alanyl-D-glutamate--2,6-diaminopimelate ligase